MNLIKKTALIACLVTSSHIVHADFADAIKGMAEKHTQQDAPKVETNKNNSPLDKLTSLESVANFAKTGKLDTNALVKELVTKECKKQINQRKEWKMASMFLSDSKKESLENKTCECATEETLKSASKDDLINVINPSTRTKTITKVTTKAVTACISKF